jgi:hypothetical protein
LAFRGENKAIAMEAMKKSLSKLIAEKGEIYGDIAIGDICAIRDKLVGNISLKFLSI